MRTKAVRRRVRDESTITSRPPHPTNRSRRFPIGPDPNQGSPRHTRTETKQARPSRPGGDLSFANLETHCVVGSPAAVAAQLGVVLWHVLGCDAGADDAAAEALANRLTRAGQQAPRRCRSRDRAGASFSPRTSSQLDDFQNSPSGIFMPRFPPVILGRTRVAAHSRVGAEVEPR